MNLQVALFQILPSAENPGNLVRGMWDRLRPLPLGPRLFSFFASHAAPYTSTIRPRVEALQTGYSRTTMRDRSGIRNHLSSVHAIALANLAEFTGNLAVAYALPADARFIVKSMSIDYVKKARGRITGECHCPGITGSERREYDVPVTLTDENDEIVATARLGTLVGPKKERA